jgi:hypothetical protein
MNYCSIDDAWGDNKISDQFQKYKNDKVCSDPTKITCPVKENKNIEQFTENNNHNIEVLTCDNILNHISQCKHCYHKMYNKFNIPQKNEFINNLHYIINNNKDTIVLMLIGIFIIMFFKLVNNITSKS